MQTSMTQPPSTDPASQMQPQPELGHSVELVRQAQGGDKQALNELFERYQDRVRRIARIRMGSKVRSFMESVDLVQNTYAVAVRRFESFELRDHASIIHWLARILENQIRDAADYACAAKRNRNKEAPIPVEQGGDSATGFAAAAKAPPPWHSLEKSELRAIFDECVQALEPRYREIVLLRDYAGGSWQYVAQGMNSTSVHAAREMHRRARIKLASMVSRRIDFDD